MSRVFYLLPCGSDVMKKSSGLMKKDGDLFGGDGWIVYFCPTNGGNLWVGWKKEFFDILANMADRTSWFLVKTLEGLGFL